MGHFGKGGGGGGVGGMGADTGHGSVGGWDGGKSWGSKGSSEGMANIDISDIAGFGTDTFSDISKGIDPATGKAVEGASGSSGGWKDIASYTEIGATLGGLTLGGFGSVLGTLAGVGYGLAKAFGGGYSGDTSKVDTNAATGVGGTAGNGAGGGGIGQKTTNIIKPAEKEEKEEVEPTKPKVVVNQFDVEDEVSTYMKVLDSKFGLMDTRIANKYKFK